MVRINPQLKDSQRSKIMNLLEQYQEVFSKEENDVGSTRFVEHHFGATTDKPVKQSDRRIPPTYLK